MKKGLTRAFTLIELMVVISIIAVLSSIILAAVSSVRAKSTIAAGQTFEGQMYQAYGALAVGVWNFDEASGTLANDTSGNRNNLTVDPALWTSQSLAFRGKSALFIPSTNHEAYPAQGNITNFNSANGSISFWINLTAGSEAGGIFCTTGSSYYDFCIDSSDNITGNFIQFGWNAGANYMTSGLPVSSFLGKWTNVALSWNGSNMLLYVNGAQVASSSSYVASSLGSSPLFCIGGASDDSNMVGYLDEMRVYSQSLQTGEIDKLYAEELPHYEHLLAVAR